MTPNAIGYASRAAGCVGARDGWSCPRCSASSSPRTSMSAPCRSLDPSECRRSSSSMARPTSDISTTRARAEQSCCAAFTTSRTARAAQRGSQSVWCAAGPRRTCRRTVCASIATASLRSSGSATAPPSRRRLGSSASCCARAPAPSRSIGARLPTRRRSPHSASRRSTTSRALGPRPWSSSAS